ncbi:MAG: rhomboid family intramembrane serine protease [Pseudonocardiaceae bacterium]
MNGRGFFRLERVPLVTGIVFTITVATSVLQFAIPGMLAALARNPQGLHGAWWRTLTALFVQDGGVPGTLSNLAFLLFIGVLAEQVLGSWRWLVCYFGAGLAGALVAYAWQPYGAGNSIAICGLAGALTVALLLGDQRAPGLTPLFLMYWCGALLGTLFWPGVLLGVAGGVLAQVALGRGLPVGKPVAVAATVVAVVLSAAQNIHGAALLAGVAIAALIALVDRRPAPVRAG